MQGHHVYASMFYHIVWSTKNRQTYISNDIKNILYKYVAKILSAKGLHLLAIGGIENHIHLLIQKTPKYTLSDIVHFIKSNSSKFIRLKFNSEFEWQSGYGVFTVDVSVLDRIKKYILNQEGHHKSIDFEKEYVLLLKKYEINHD